MKIWQRVAAIGISLIIVITISWAYIAKSNLSIDEWMIRRLAWNQLSKDVRKELVGGIENSRVSKFKVKKDSFEGVVFENGKTFDHKKYIGETIYLVIFQYNIEDEGEPYLVYIDPITTKIIVTRWGLIIKEDFLP